MVPSRLRDPDRARSREDLCKTPKSRPAENETEQTRRASSLNKIACYLLQRYLVAIRVPAPCLKTRIIPTLRLKTRIAPPLYGLPYARATHAAWYTCTAAGDARNGPGHMHIAACRSRSSKFPRDGKNRPLCRRRRSTARHASSTWHPEVDSTPVVERPASHIFGAGSSA